MPASSKIEALRMVADYSSTRLEDFYRSVMQNPDELSVNFIELLDQIVFELLEDMPSDNAVREYVTEDLCCRLNVYLDIFQARDTYASKLNRRLLTHEDTVIIRQCGMKEYLPLLMSEYYEQPTLQRSIMRALLSFEADDLLNFYYGIAKEGTSIELKVMALVGLKKFGTRFRHWDVLSANNYAYDQMIAYAGSFNCAEVDKNEIPGDLYSLLFALTYIETNEGLLMSPDLLAWAVTLIRSMMGEGYYSSYPADLYRSICDIIVFSGPDSLNQVIQSEEHLKALVQIVDFLPREYFDRITPKLELLGDQLIRRVNGLVSSRKIDLDERNSNMFCYLLWKSGNNL
ncbi:MAG: hypothetical protein JW807_16595 [Spirochaetes bacterium]|nr:hypothetical protein [Spirochaetota bacterium]